MLLFFWALLDFFIMHLDFQSSGIRWAVVPPPPPFFCALKGKATNSTSWTAVIILPVRQCHDLFHASADALNQRREMSRSSSSRSGSSWVSDFYCAPPSSSPKDFCYKKKGREFDSSLTFTWTEYIESFLLRRLTSPGNERWREQRKGFLCKSNGNQRCLHMNVEYDSFNFLFHYM